MHSLLPAALPALALIALESVLTWIASLVRRDASLVDRMWPVFIASASLTYLARLPEPGWRGQLASALVVAWGVRLCIYITRRNWGHGEDRRYQEIRARNQPGFAWKSLVYVFALQAVLAWIVSSPVLAAAAAPARPAGVADLAGAALALFGLVFEAVADAQMARFKADPAHRGAVMDRGLWALSRHPNYFGETCFWWGIGLLALAAGGLQAAWSLASPALMTFLLLKVSGVTLLEKDIGERRPAYRDYVMRTSAFLPRPPRPSRQPPG